MCRPVATNMKPTTLPSLSTQSSSFCCKTKANRNPAIWMHAHMQIRMHARTSVHAQAHARTHARTHTHALAQAHAQTQTSSLACIHARSHANAHCMCALQACTRARACTRTLALSLSHSPTHVHADTYMNACSPKMSSSKSVGRMSCSKNTQKCSLRPLWPRCSGWTFSLATRCSMLETQA